VAKAKLETLLAEIDSMDNYERKLKRNIFRQIKEEYSKVRV
jgi:hypothetical protein